MNNYLQYIIFHLQKRTYLRAILNPHLLSAKQKAFLIYDDRDLYEGLEYYEKLRNGFKNPEWLAMPDKNSIDELDNADISDWECERFIAMLFAEYLSKKNK